MGNWESFFFFLEPSLTYHLIKWLHDTHMVMITKLVLSVCRAEQEESLILQYVEVTMSRKILYVVFSEAAMPHL